MNFFIVDVFILRTPLFNIFLKLHQFNYILKFNIGLFKINKTKLLTVFSSHQDIVWGSVIGATIATISYFYYYPSLWDPLSDKPRDSEHVGKQFMKNSVPLLPQSVKVM